MERSPDSFGKLEFQEALKWVVELVASAVPR
jgi:hypothetical protein